MVKAPSSHGLDRKFKSWRKGKSQNPKSKNRTSLKHQLRGQTRLLTKVQDEEHRQVLQKQIDELKTEIAAKEQVEQERVNAQKSHGTRFLERQRLVRLERNVRKNPNLSDATKEAEYFKIALDMAYVAHFPHDVVKYMPIFHKGTRVVDSGRHLNRRAVTRQRVLANADTGAGAEARVSWISSEMYNRLPTQEWTLELERATFAGEGTESDAATEQGGGGASQDNRFAVDNMESSALLLEAAEEIETKLDQEETLKSKNDKEAESSSDSDSSSADSAGKADLGGKSDPPLKSAGAKKQVATGVENSKKKSSSDSDDTSDSSSSSDSEEEGNVKNNGKGKADSESSDSDSSDSSDSSDEEAGVKESNKKGTPKVEIPKVDEIMEEVDDFLVPVDEGKEQDFFANAKSNIPTRDELKGDKSKGWATQNQRPGQFKKKRIRR